MISPEKYQFRVALLYFLVISGLYAIQYFYPQYIVHYESFEDRFYDMYFTFAYNILVLYALVRYALDNYRKEKRKHEIERNKVELVNIELQEKNEMILEQKEELEALNESLIEKNQHIMEQNQRLEELNNKLFEANSAKDAFFSIISHDLKNPLSAIKTYIEILKYRDKIEEAQMSEMTDALDKAVGSVCDMLDNLLNWARAQSGKIKSFPDVLPVGALIESLLESFKLGANSKKIKINTQIKNDVLAYADPDLVRIIIANLVSNALKFSYVDSEIKILASDDRLEFDTAPKVCIRVVDNGVGISPEAISNLFRIDVHHSSVGTRNERGTGLGLILCKEFAEKCGGDIYVESEVGKGSVFSLVLPAKSH
jgi:signal transduction histidine kinase